MTSSDRIEKKIVLNAPRERVWQALTDAAKFGSWFGVKFDGAFKVGSPIRGNLTNRGYEKFSLEIVIDRIDPETFFSYKWHPFAMDPAADYSSEPMTLVEFHVEEVPDGTSLTVVESGFDKIPEHRRAEAFPMNDKGWTSQMKNIQRYVEG